MLQFTDGSTGAVFVGCILRAQITQAEVAAPLQRRSRHEMSINEAIDSAEPLCKVHGISRLATYDTEPLAIETKVRPRRRAQPPRHKQAVRPNRFQDISFERRRERRRPVQSRSGQSVGSLHALATRDQTITRRSPGLRGLVTVIRPSPVPEPWSKTVCQEESCTPCTAATYMQLSTSSVRA